MQMCIHCFHFLLRIAMAHCLPLGVEVLTKAVSKVNKANKIRHTKP